MTTILGLEYVDAKNYPLFQRLRTCLFLLNMFYILFYVGAFFGFGPMEVMLEKDGAFSHDVCTTSSCNTQAHDLIQVSIIAAVLAQLSTPVSGAISDRYGPVVLQSILCIIGCCGIGLILISSMTHTSWILYLAFILIGFMAMGTAPMIMQLAELYSLETSRRRVITTLESLWAVGGGFGYWILWALTKAGIPFRVVIGCYLAVGFIVYATTIAVWKAISSLQQRQDYSVENVVIDINTCAGTCVEHVSQEKDPDNNASLGPSHTTNIGELGLADEVQLCNHSDKHNTYCENQTDSPCSHIQRDADIESTIEEPIHHETFLQQARSFRFILISGLFALHLARMSFTLTTAKDFLGSLGDNAIGNKYLSILSLSTPIVLLGLPLVELFVKNWGYIFALQSINVVGISHGLVLLTTTNLNAQVVGFILFMFYRCFLLSICLSYLETFAEKHALGKLTGLISFFPGLVILLNIPLTHWAMVDRKGDFFWPNFTYTIAIVPFIVGVWYLGRSYHSQQ